MRFCGFYKLRFCSPSLKDFSPGFRVVSPKFQSIFLLSAEMPIDWPSQSSKGKDV